MSVPQDKQALLEAIDKTFARLIVDLEAVPDTLTSAAEMEGHAQGTQMSPADLVAYLIGWNELVIKWLEKDAADQITDFPETGFRWNELGRLAQKFYGDYAPLSYAERLTRLREAKNRIVGIIETTDNDALYGRPWYGKWTMGRMIQFNTSSPYANARSRLRKYLKTKTDIHSSGV